MTEPTPPMAEIVIRAAYASVVEEDEDGALFIGFAEGEDEDEPYCLFRQALIGGPIWFQVNDESLEAEDAVQALQLGPKGLEITLRPEKAAQLGWATHVRVRIGPECESADEAIAALRVMLGPIFVG
jgi:hypothetical protein